MNKFYQTFSCLLIAFFIPSFLNAGIAQLLPKPQMVTALKGHFKIENVSLNTNVLYNDWVDLINELNGEIVCDNKFSINVYLVDSISNVFFNKDEAYSIKVNSKSIHVEAFTETGVYWAIQTLRQLKLVDRKNTYIEACEIIDWPAFRIRGFMHDVGRGYISISELKEEIKNLSQFKINTFHWHLTEDISWRLESKIFPMLNDSLNTSRLPGKYYSLQEAKDLVLFCKNHHVLLIPEIDMPGHSLAFQKTFRHSMQSKEGTAILKLLLDEIIEVFDVPYIHIGTDEVKIFNTSFVSEMVQYIRNKGKKVIAWNPGWDFKKDEIDMTHLWSYRGRFKEGVTSIDSRFHYANHYDAFADIFALYNSKICGVDVGSESKAGVIIAFWNDRSLASEKNIILENGFYPSMLTMAERAWRGGGNEYFDKFGVNIPPEETVEFKQFQEFERRLLWHKYNNLIKVPFAYVKQTNVKWKLIEPFSNEGDLLQSFPPENSNLDCGLFETRDAIGATIYLRHVWGKLLPAFYDNPLPNHTVYAYTFVYSPYDQPVGLFINFQNYSRSESDLPPQKEKWDYNESAIWINDELINPPKWINNHTVRSQEISLGNENFEARPPHLVRVKKGWNKVLLKLPIGTFSRPEVRLVKWMFTAVFVSIDGAKAVDGLVYSPCKIIENE